MTVKILKPKTNRKITGLSSDIKPTLGIDDIGDEFYEFDTYDVYTWFGDRWVNTLRSGLPNDEHSTEENHELMEVVIEIVQQLKILNIYMSHASNETLTIEDIGD